MIRKVMHSLHYNIRQAAEYSVLVILSARKQRTTKCFIVSCIPHPFLLLLRQSSERIEELGDLIIGLEHPYIIKDYR